MVEKKKIKMMVRVSIFEKLVIFSNLRRLIFLVVVGEVEVGVSLDFEKILDFVGVC